MLGIKANSLTFKTSVVYIILTVLIISIFNFIIWENQSDLIIRNQKLISETQFLKITEAVRVELQKRTDAQPLDFAKLAKAAWHFGAVGVDVYSEAGNLIFSTAKKSPEMAGQAELVEINRAVAKYGLEDKEFYPVLSDSKDAIKLYVPFHGAAGGEMQVIRFHLPMQSMEKERDILLRLCLLVAGIVVLLQVFFGMFLRKMVIRPIIDMEKITYQVSQGEFNQRIELKREDEIGHLASSFNEMIQSLIKIREEAQGSNPLSGLPGNNVIVRTIEERIAKEEEFAVIYGDLDNFKAYNDKYGFSKGDDAILYTRDIFLQVAKKFGDANTFIGHEGGDDFVIITPFHTWDSVCKGIVSSFDDGIRQFYNDADAKQGFIDSVDRQGRRVRFPLMSISLAVVSNHFRKVRDHRELVSAAAEMKKFVKKSEGSTFAIDKRTT